MKIEGTYTLHAPPGQVWHGMQNPHILRQIVPGLKKIEALDEQTFTFYLAMNQAPFVGSYEGHITITGRQYPYHFRVTIQSKSDQGLLRGDIYIHLQDREESTIVAYTGTISRDSDGQENSTRLARGAAKLLVQQFFTALNNQLYTNAPGEGKPEQEHLWLHRLRIASMIAGLLFLIWIGMQIPRRQQRK